MLVKQKNSEVKSGEIFGIACYEASKSIDAIDSFHSTYKRAELNHEE